MKRKEKKRKEKGPLAVLLGCSWGLLGKKRRRKAAAMAQQLSTAETVQRLWKEVKHRRKELEVKHVKAVCWVVRAQP